jgi:hypothetical protein
VAGLLILRISVKFSSVLKENCLRQQKIVYFHFCFVQEKQWVFGWLLIFVDMKFRGFVTKNIFFGT